MAPLGNAMPPTPEPVPFKRSPAHDLWAVSIARIHEVCPLCGGQMRRIAFITHSADIRHILNHIGVDCAPPRSAPARVPPLWDAYIAPVGAGVQAEPDRAIDRDRAARPAADYAVDQRVNWCGSKAALATGCGSMLRARLPPGDFATESLAVQVVRQSGKQALVGAVTHPTRVILRSERLNFLCVSVGGVAKFCRIRRV